MLDRIAATLVGRSKAMLKLRNEIARVGPTPHWLWLIGETGTGKGVAAQLIHEISRPKGAFVELNSVRLRSSLLESTLYGHARGSFTGAYTDMPGRYEQADGGTLFFSEGARTGKKAQGMLLEILDRRGFAPIGKVRTIGPDVRVLFGSSVEPRELIADSDFEEHFYYRLGAIELRIPPLRERLEDIPELLDRIRDSLSGGVNPAVWTRAAIDLLRDYQWPGNVRQLENVVRAVHAWSGHSEVSPGIVADVLATQPAGHRSHASGDARLDEALSANRGIIAMTARAQGTSESTIRRSLRRRGLTPSNFRPASRS